MGIGLAAGLVAAVLYGVAAPLQAIAARRLPDGPFLLVLRSGSRDRLMFVSVVLYLLGWVLQVVAVVRLPLYLAQSLVAASLLFTAFASARLVGERPARRHLVALGMVSVGLTLLVVAAGRPGTHHFGSSFTVGLWLGLVTLVGLAAAAGRLPGRGGGTLTGVLAGAAYGGAPLAVRAIGHPHVDPLTSATAVSVVLFGVLGFTLYASAMQRTTVTAATAPLVITETLMPAVVGVVFLNDGVRSGWWPGIAAGLALCVGGALGVADVEPTEETSRLSRVSRVSRHSPAPTARRSGGTDT